MTATLDCPRCRIPLTRLGGHEKTLRCAACSGAWVPAAELLDTAAESLTVAASGTGSAPGTADRETLCPGCRIAMQVVTLGEARCNRCPVCGGVWLDRDEVCAVLPTEGGEAADAATKSDPLAAIGRYLLYSLTLPERAVRSTVGLAAGAVQEAAEFLVPQAFQSSKTYEVVVRNSLRFLTQDVGGVQAAPGAEPPVQDYLARKAVGNFIDLAGLATLHVSPLWILAAVSDVAYGSETFVRELAEELQRQNLIADSSTVHRIDDVLAALRRSTSKAAGLLDTPPLDVDQLQAALAETRDSLAEADLRELLPESEVRRYWGEMREIAGREGVSLLGLSGTLTMHALGKVESVGRGALSGVRVAGGLFRRHVLDHYVDSLVTVRRRGVYDVLRESSEPYVAAVWHNFSGTRETWTADLLTGRTLAGAWQKVAGWFAPKPK